MFIDKRINEVIETISLESAGGPMFSTNVVSTAGGGEQRNINWSVSRGRWEFGERLLNQIELNDLLDFFQEAAGRANSFRFKDFADHTCKPGRGFAKRTARGLQLVKRYGEGATARDRIVTLPVNPVVTYNGSVVQATVDENGVLDFGVPDADEEKVAWHGEFDLRARFDTDQLTHRFDGIDSEDHSRKFFHVFSLPVVELQ